MSGDGGVWGMLLGPFPMANHMGLYGMMLLHWKNSGRNTRLQSPPNKNRTAQLVYISWIGDRWMIGIDSINHQHTTPSIPKLQSGADSMCGHDSLKLVAGNAFCRQINRFDHMLNMLCWKWFNQPKQFTVIGHWIVSSNCWWQHCTFGPSFGACWFSRTSIYQPQSVSIVESIDADGWSTMVAFQSSNQSSCLFFDVFFIHHRNGFKCLRTHAKLSNQNTTFQHLYNTAAWQSVACGVNQGGLPIFLRLCLIMLKTSNII